MADFSHNYEKFVENLQKGVHTAEKYTRDQMEHWVESSEEYIRAAKDMTKDEAGLVRQAVKRDMKELADSYQRSKENLDTELWFNALRQTTWHWLAELTDRTRMEWVEVASDLDHNGRYQAGEMVGFGVLVCEDCHHAEEYEHPQEIKPCPKCQGTAFRREPLQP